jgi:serine/threonine protein kinase
VRLHDAQLRDLPAGTPLVESSTGRPTGIRFGRWLGSGGMAVVFEATFDTAQTTRDLSPLTPPRLAIKIPRPEVYREAERLNLDPSDIFVREAVALGRMMERQPPTEFVLGFYGCGRFAIEWGGKPLSLPWLAIEYVDGGVDGATLADRVVRAGAESIDPVRALRLLRGTIEGVRALHSAGIIHRDVKPENVLVTGPVDDEVPKLSDCGIARVEGLAGTIAAMTPDYGGPEQALSMLAARNPLVGPWTDVHALSAVAWFVLAGENWCRESGDTAWQRGQRRSLRTSRSLHPGYATSPELLAELDAVLRRGAAPRPPAAAFEAVGAEPYLRDAQKTLPALLTGEERFATVDAFAEAILPLLERCAAAWVTSSAATRRAVTAFRATVLASGRGAFEESRRFREIPCPGGEELRRGGGAALETDADSVVFLPDGKVLGRFGEQLLYFADDRPRSVAVPEELRSAVGASRWLVRGPGGGYALVGPSRVLLIRRGVFLELPLPVHPSGAGLGPIQAVVDNGRVFGVVTAETDDSNGGAELWTSSDGATWSEPIVLPLGGEVQAISYGPYGYLVVGSRKRRNARALFLPFDQPVSVYVDGVNSRSPLRLALCGAAQQSWGAGVDYVLGFNRGTVEEETFEWDEAPVAWTLDLVGVPWVVTRRAVLRRVVESGRASWRVCYRREEGRPPFVAIGMFGDGGRVLDAAGNTVRIHLGELADETDGRVA